MSAINWRCGIGCGPGLVQCRTSGSGVECLPPGQCSTENRVVSRFSSVWLLPPSVVDPNKDQSIPFEVSSLWENLPESYDDSVKLQDS